MASTTQTPVADVMTAPLETIAADATVREAAERMRKRDINALFVPGVDAGIVTTTDVVAAVAEGADLDETTVGDVMTAPVERITTAEDLSEAAAMMTTFGIKHLPVIDDDGDYVGMVSTTDLTTQLA
ncbi:IMP dehydrogenase [Halopenitus malekzadehii]|uniref:IMP dehydrogenase n=1 Tax=Halopenitus malekzadehii TaxID=1267564 RepID=A0A1H6IID1_9EURY|nr:CBS domain-containing protein [Halopenitus malekzadehii]SEH46666.1 IMP dehydrogenase [Halopenitus malekzadehii]